MKVRIIYALQETVT